MPIKKIQKKCKNDKFYTRSDVAADCVDVIKKLIPDDNIVFIEPSAGSGSFSSLINCYAFDIEPDTESIIKADFLLVEDSWKTQTLCVFGNPPFGERNNMTNAFIKKAISLVGTRYIAFILPAVYKKRTMQKVFPSDWQLIHYHDLPRDSFLLNGVAYHVPCVFQIWEKNSLRPDLREVAQPSECSDFTFVTKENADIFVFGAAPTKIIVPADVAPTNRGYFLRSKIDIAELRDRITSVDWKSCAASSVNGGAAWFSKDEFVKHYIAKHGV